jgi:hypothetical protein
LKDYKALIGDLSKPGSRKPIRHVICLNPDLYQELEEAEQELRDARQDADLDEPKPGVDRRAGALSPVQKAEARVAEIESRIGEVSIVGVFRPYDSGRIAKEIDKAQKMQEDSPDRINELALENARETILETFQHFEGRDERGELQRIPDLGKEDLEAILDAWPFGQIFGLGQRITAAATRVYDAPKSVRSSLLNQHSDETSS